LIKVCSGTDQKSERILVWEVEPNAKFKVEHRNTVYTYDLDQLKANLEMRKQFDAYITDQAAERHKVEEHEEKQRSLKAEAYLPQTAGQFTEADIQDSMMAPAEFNGCTRPLTPAQELMVVASHQTMNMNQTAVFSTKSFTIMNDLQQHIRVALKYTHDELSQSSPAAQMIPLFMNFMKTVCDQRSSLMLS
jgi:hypothetical protein